MAYLILDLDETVIKYIESEQVVHPAQVLSLIPGKILLGEYNCIFHIINMEKISRLIRKAYTEHDGIIIMTSGMWPKIMRDQLAENLDLPEEIREKIRECRFHSAITDANLLNLHPMVVRLLPKGERFKAILEKFPEMHNKNFVMLDNDEFHLDSFSDFLNVTTVLATTKTASMEFYQEAMDAMDIMQLMEIRDPEVRKEAMGKRDAFFSSESPKAKRRAPSAPLENLPVHSLEG